MSKLDSKVSFKVDDKGVVVIAGEVNYHTAIQLLAATNSLLSGTGPWIVDMSGVSRSDSSAVAWMLDWQRKSRKKQANIQFRAVPSEIVAIARVSGVEALLPIIA